MIKLKEVAPDNDPYGTKKLYPIGKRISGSITPDGKIYTGKVVGYSRTSDDVYINVKGKRIRLAGVSIS